MSAPTIQRDGPTMLSEQLAEIQLGEPLSEQPTHIVDARLEQQTVHSCAAGF